MHVHSAPKVATPLDRGNDCESIEFPEVPSHSVAINYASIASSDSSAAHSSKGTAPAKEVLFDRSAAAVTAKPVEVDAKPMAMIRYLRLLVMFSPEPLSSLLAEIEPVVVRWTSAIHFILLTVYILLEILLEIGIELYAVLQPYKPERLVPSFAGLVMCFFGGSFVTTIAAAEAYRLVGYESTMACVQSLLEDYRAILQAAERDAALGIDDLDPDFDFEGQEQGLVAVGGGGDDDEDVEDIDIDLDMGVNSGTPLAQKGKGTGAGKDDSGDSNFDSFGADCLSTATALRVKKEEDKESFDDVWGDLRQETVSVSEKARGPRNIAAARAARGEEGEREGESISNGAPVRSLSAQSQPQPQRRRSTFYSDGSELLGGRHAYKPSGDYGGMAPLTPVRRTSRPSTGTGTGTGTGTRTGGTPGSSAGIAAVSGAATAGKASAFGSPVASSTAAAAGTGTTATGTKLRKRRSSVYAAHSDVLDAFRCTVLEQQQQHQKEMLETTPLSKYNTRSSARYRSHFVAPPSSQPASPAAPSGSTSTRGRADSSSNSNTSLRPVSISRPPSILPRQLSTSVKGGSNTPSSSTGRPQSGRLTRSGSNAHVGGGSSSSNDAMNLVVGSSSSSKNTDKGKEKDNTWSDVPSEPSSEDENYLALVEARRATREAALAAAAAAAAPNSAVLRRRSSLGATAAPPSTAAGAGAGERLGLGLGLAPGTSVPPLSLAEYQRDQEVLGADTTASRFLFFLQNVDPNRFTTAVIGLNAGMVAVVATLKVQFAKTITLGTLTAALAVV
jgi:hypothetical protein